MSRLYELTPRSAQILNSIVRTYIETGEPVASKVISHLRRHRLSSASVRNVMAELAEAGYLSQPHTSAGRLPTEKAFRAYVQSLTASRLLAAELARLRRQLSEIETLAGRVERSSHILTEMTQSVGIAAAIPTSAQALEQVELVGLADRRVLMIVVTRDKIVRNRVITLDEFMPQHELDSIRNYLNHNFCGWVLSDVHRALQTRLEQASAAYDEILKKLNLLYEKGLLDVGLAPEIHMEGIFNLLGIDFHLTREKMRELFQTLEEKKRILQLLDRFLEQKPGEVTVQVGLGDAHPIMEELSLIGICVTLPSGVGAKVAVLGPLRMDYAKVMSAVLHVGQAFRSVTV